MNWASEAPLVVKNVPAVPSGPTKLYGPAKLLLAATWKRGGWQLGARFEYTSAKVRSSLGWTSREGPGTPPSPMTPLG